MSKKVKIRFQSTVTVEQTIEVDDGMDATELVASLNGETERDLATGMLKGSELLDITEGCDSIAVDRDWETNFNFLCHIYCIL